MRGWQYYGTKTLQVVPYMPGTPVYIDATMPHVYAQLREEEKVTDMFCGEFKSLDEFISYFHALKTAQILCRVKEDLRLEPVGISWVMLPRGVDGARVAQCGFAFFGGSGRSEDSRSLARLGVAYFFEDLRIDVLHGVQVKENLMARNFAQNIGFEEVAIVPKWHFIAGELWDARILMLEKESWMPGFEAWFAGQEPRIEKAVEPS